LAEEDNRIHHNVNIETDFIKLNIEIDDLSLINENQEELFKSANILYKIQSVFCLRERFREIYQILPNELIIFFNKNNWAKWEIVLLILFSNHSFPTNRNEIWNYDISQSTLRGIIRDRTDYIESLDEDKLKLAEEGLAYILKKLNDELTNYRNILQEESNNE